MADIFRRYSLSCATLIFLFGSGCISRPFIFKKNPDTRLPYLVGGSVVTAQNGKRTVYGFFTKRGERLVVLFHGQASTMAREANFGSVFASHGFSVLLVEYAGYGLARKNGALGPVAGLRCCRGAAVAPTGSRRDSRNTLHIDCRSRRAQVNPAFTPIIRVG